MIKTLRILSLILIGSDISNALNYAVKKANQSAQNQMSYAVQEILHYDQNLTEYGHVLNLSMHFDLVLSVPSADLTKA